MLVDSHCHLNFPELVQNMDQVLENMRSHQVGHALCVSVTLDKFPEVLAIAEQYPNIYASVGVHPDYEDIQEPTVDGLVSLADHGRVVAIGETGLDYFRLTGDLEWQRERFRTHIRAAQACRKPLVIHTRASSADTLAILKEQGEDGSATQAGGVFHCFTESMEVAKAALDIGYYISFSGILTFKNAQDLRDVAAYIPLDRMLIETDSPYLAPVPYRGKTNNPSYVPYVAQQVAQLRGISAEEVGRITSANFDRLFAGVVA